MLLLILTFLALVVAALALVLNNMVLNVTGVVRCLEVERTYLNTLDYRLYVNAYTPVVTSAAINFTSPVDSGYAPWTPGFTASFLNGSNFGETDGPAHTITFTYSGGTPFTVHGYWVTDPGDGLLIFAEEAPATLTVTAAGYTYTVTPRKQMTSI